MTVKNLTLLGLKVRIDDVNSPEVVMNNSILNAHNYLNDMIKEENINESIRPISMLLANVCTEYIKSMDFSKINEGDYRTLYDLVYNS